MMNIPKKSVTNFSRINRITVSPVVLLLSGCFFMLAPTARSQAIITAPNKKNSSKSEFYEINPCRSSKNQGPEYLANAIKDLKNASQDWNSRRSAAVYLCGRNSAEVNQALKDAALNDPDVNVQGAAINSLINNLGEKNTFEFLVESLKDPSPKVRREAALLLTATPNGKAVELLINLLQNDPDRNVRALATGAVGWMRDTVLQEPANKQAEVTQALITALNDQDSLIRDAAVWPLGRILGEKSFEFLAQAAKDQDVWVRAVAAWQLGALRNKEATALLINLLQNDQVPQVRTAAARALASMTYQVPKGSANKEAITADPLIEALRDPSPWVRGAAAKGLRDLNVTRAIDPLVELLGSEEDQGVRDKAEQSLKHLRAVLDEEINYPQQ